jgi:hypothetical protein
VPAVETAPTYERSPPARAGTSRRGVLSRVRAFRECPDPPRAPVHPAPGPVRAGGLRRAVGATSVAGRRSSADCTGRRGHAAVGWGVPGAPRDTPFASATSAVSRRRIDAAAL